LHERTGRPAEFFTGLAVHAGGRVVVASAYAGKLRVLDFRTGDPGEGFDAKWASPGSEHMHHTDHTCSIPELNVLSLAFLPTPVDRPVLALLHRTPAQRLQLLARTLHADQFEFAPEPSPALPQTLLSAAAFPPALADADAVPALVPLARPAAGAAAYEDFHGGVLVLGGRKIVLYPMATDGAQADKAARRARGASRRKSSGATDTAREKERTKEAARELMKRKPLCSVEWPWAEVTA
jgi:DNA damage-binding protein 1